MSDTDVPEPPSEVESVSPRELKARIHAGDDVFLLDTRTESDYAEWRIDGEPVESLNIPYFEFLAGDPEEVVFDGVPDDRRVIVACAKGDSSEYVAGLLDERGYDVAHLERGMNGWASIYEYEEIDTGGGPTVAQYRRPSSGCLAYLIVSDGDAAVVDPLRAFVGEYRQDARALGADVAYAMDTHVHADHVSGVRRLADSTGADVVLPEPAIERGIEYDVDVSVTHGDELPLGDAAIEVVHAPGHTTGMTAYRVDDVLFTGDGLFTESVARPDLEWGHEGAPDAAGRLYDTLQDRILSLPDETVVAPGHFGDAATQNADGTYTATIGELRESMSALSMDRDEFVELVLSDMPERPANFEDIVETNLGRAEVGDREAFQLELGPNNCAASTDSLAGE